MPKRELLPEQQIIVKKFWAEALKPEGALNKASRICAHLARHILECQLEGIPPQRDRIEKDIVDATDAILAFKGCIDDAFLSVDKSSMISIMAEVKNWPRPESGQRHYFNSAFKSDPPPVEKLTTPESSDPTL